MAPDPPGRTSTRGSSNWRRGRQATSPLPRHAIWATALAASCITWRPATWNGSAVDSTALSACPPARTRTSLRHGSDSLGAAESYPTTPRSRCMTLRRLALTRFTLRCLASIGPGTRSQQPASSSTRRPFRCGAMKWRRDSAWIRRAVPASGARRTGHPGGRRTCVRTPHQAGFRSAVEAQLRQRARHLGVPAYILRRQAGLERLAVRLTAVAPGRWALKGGFALETRLGGRARASVDLDADHLNGAEAARADLQRAAIAEAGDHFGFAVTGSEELRSAGVDLAVRYKLECSLAGRPYEPLQVDVSTAAPDPWDAQAARRPGLLAELGLDPIDVWLIPLERQVAEKLHAYTRTVRGRQHHARQGSRRSPAHPGARAPGRCCAPRRHSACLRSSGDPWHPQAPAASRARACRGLSKGGKPGGGCLRAGGGASAPCRLARSRVGLVEMKGDRAGQRHDARRVRRRDIADVANPASERHSRFRTHPRKGERTR